MKDYKVMYFELRNNVNKAIEILQRAQQNQDEYSIDFIEDLENENHEVVYFKKKYEN